MALAGSLLVCNDLFFWKWVRYISEDKKNNQVLLLFFIYKTTKESLLILY
jgi:hypothetical protein